jgi:hypothetical protein
LGPACQWQTTPPTVNAHDTRGFGSVAPQIYKSQEREGRILYLTT